MTIVERNNKLKHFITCLKCEVSGKNCDVNCPTQYDAGNMGEIIENLESISKALEQEPCEDAVSRKEVHDMLENLPITVEDKWFNWLQKACIRLAGLPPVTSQELILDKIRAEIWDLQYGDEEKSMTDEDRADAYNNAIIQAIEIIDKYKAESVEE